MFHVEMRMGVNAVREFNLSDQRLWSAFLAPLMADLDFTMEGHDFTPRQTRLKVYEGPELRPDQLGMGRGWHNVERLAIDVTDRVLQQARAQAATSSEAPAVRPPRQLPAAAELIRERLLGRMAAGPAAAEEILAIAAELMPQADEPQRLEAARDAVWMLLERRAAQLTPSGR